MRTTRRSAKSKLRVVSRCLMFIVICVETATHACGRQLVNTFDNPPPPGFDQFGWSVAIDSGLVLVGAPDDNTNGPDVGQAHLFDATTGVLLRTLEDPTATDRDYFGNSVVLNGNRALVGAPRDSTRGPNVGQAHLFDGERATFCTDT